MFTSVMLRAMRRTVPEGGLIPRSLGEKIYTDMLDSEYAHIMSRNASFGLADQIVKQIEGGNGEGASLSSLKSLGHTPWAIDNRLVPGQQFSSPGGSLLERIGRWNELINEASEQYDVDRDLIAAVVAQESAGKPYAVSRAGAKGLMQLMDSTARHLGVQRVFNPRENVLGGTRYLKSLLNDFGGDETLALASYNAGPGAVKKYGGVPPYLETTNYVKSVLAMREQLRAGRDVATDDSEGE